MGCRSGPVLVFLLAAFAGGCGRPTGVDPHLDRAYPDRLSEWRLFTATRPSLQVNSGVLPYDLNTPLFSDYADKFRTVWMPAGQTAQYRGEDVFSFPVGTIFTKTFSFRQKSGNSRLIETRLIVRQRDGWVTLPYIWNTEQTEAELDTAPLPVRVNRVDATGAEHTSDYSIPNVNQCSLCHEGGAPLGPKARNLNRTFRYDSGPENQLVRWARAGYLTGTPAAASLPRLSIWNDPATGSVEQRANAYLEVNCAHCHREGTRAKTLDLNPCKAGEIVKRMESLDPEKTMPSLAHDEVHREAVQLMREWIAQGCPAT